MNHRRREVDRLRRAIVDLEIETMDYRADIKSLESRAERAEADAEVAKAEASSARVALDAFACAAEHALEVEEQNRVLDALTRLVRREGCRSVRSALWAMSHTLRWADKDLARRAGGAMERGLL